MTLSRRQRHEQQYAIRDWKLEAPHNPEERIHWLRAEAMALLSEARDLELRLPFPPEHNLKRGTGCRVCEICRLDLLKDAKQMGYDK